MEKETTDPMSQNEVNDSPSAKLAELARQAYEQKRTKECMDLTRAILLIDPDNADAQRIRSSIESDMQRDLENACGFLRQADSNPTAKRSLPTAPPGSSIGHFDSGAGNTYSFRADHALPPERQDRWWLTRDALWLAVPILIVLGGLVVALPRPETRPNAADAYVGAADISKPIATEKPNPEVSHTLEVVAADPINKPKETVPARPTKLPDSPAVPAGTGTLAVSSPTSVDIYEDDAYVGSVPVSLELSAGAHTLEYRHGNLRRMVTHMINTKETTKAMITFEISAQINSKPWADVFLDGVERKPLGQTPLSGVQVPIGGVLLFENPEFESKRYRVTGNETGIRNVFP